MARVVIVGDGPAGLSAALFLAKNEVEAVVFGQDETAMHYAHLHNYLGVEDLGGSAFQAIARRQVEAHGAELSDAEVTGILKEEERFTVRSDAGEVEADYVILSREAGKDVHDWDTPPRD